MPTDQTNGRSVSRQFHQTTQPLSVLQGLLELSLIRSTTVEEYRLSIERALKELARVTICFAELRRLIDAAEQGAKTGANHG